MLHYFFFFIYFLIKNRKINSLDIKNSFQDNPENLIVEVSTLAIFYIALETIY